MPFWTWNMELQEHHRCLRWVCCQVESASDELAYALECKEVLTESKASLSEQVFRCFARRLRVL